MLSVNEDLKQYRAILLNGCAVLGAAHLGFLLGLERENKLRFLKVLSGTSIGSVVALFYLAKVPLDAVARIFRERTLLSFLQPLESIQEMVDEGGFATSDALLSFCNNILRDHGIDGNTLTFETLRNIGRNTDLIVVASRCNRTRGTFEPEYFTTKTHPKMLVLDAIRLSINIPLLFTTPTHEGDQYADGVLTDELPFSYIQDQYSIVIDDMLAHAPYTKIRRDASSFSILFRHCLTKLRHASAPHRILHTPLEIGTHTSEIMASPELIDYFIITGIINTRKYLRCP